MYIQTLSLKGESINEHPKTSNSNNGCKINLRTIQPTQRIEQPKADLDIQQPKAKMEIQTTKSKLSIDAFEMRESMGYKNARALTREAAQKAIQDVLEGIGRRARRRRTIDAD